MKNELDLPNMTYQEFKEWCSNRACDGQWSYIEATCCLDIIDEIDSIKVLGGFFRKKATIKAREAEWRKRGYTSLI